MKKLLTILCVSVALMFAVGCREYMVPIMVEGNSNFINIETNANVPKVITISPKIDIPVDVVPGVGITEFETKAIK